MKTEMMRILVLIFFSISIVGLTDCTGIKDSMSASGNTEYDDVYFTNEDRTYVVSSSNNNEVEKAQKLNNDEISVNPYQRTATNTNPDAVGYDGDYGYYNQEPDYGYFNRVDNYYNNNYYNGFGSGYNNFGYSPYGYNSWYPNASWNMPSNQFSLYSGITFGTPVLGSMWNSPWNNWGYNNWNNWGYNNWNNWGYPYYANPWYSNAYYPTEHIIIRTQNRYRNDGRRGATINNANNNIAIQNGSTVTPNTNTKSRSSRTKYTESRKKNYQSDDTYRNNYNNNNSNYSDGSFNNNSSGKTRGVRRR